MGRLFIISISFLIVFCSCNNRAKESINSDGKTITLAKDRKTDYVIKVSTDDIVANTAAKELAQYLKDITGANFPITGLQDPIKKPFIAVGPDAAKKFFPDQNIDFAKLGNDGIIIKTFDENLLITGAEGAKRGTLYAAYEFLEGFIGVRWWTSKDTFIPKFSTLTLVPLNVVYTPKFINREVFYRDVQKNPIFAARCRANGEWEHAPAEYGGNCLILGHTHTFYKLLPPKKYFKDHPEWYSLSKDGKRSCGEGSQLCLSNDEMRKELTRNALEWLRKEPSVEMISISQNDGCVGNGCYCEKCLTLVKKEGFPSGPLIKFVNQVAEDIEKEFPKVYVNTLAYGYTRQPPLTLKPRKNVVIQLCGGGDTGSQIGPLQESFRNDVEKWREISSHLFIWTYVANFKNYLQPYPNLPVLGPYLRFFAEHNTIGICCQGDGETYCGDFVELRAWVCARLMWNPYLDENTLITEFMNGYYGKAAKPLMQYLEFIRETVKRPGAEKQLNNSYAWWLSIDDMKHADKLFEEAAKNVSNNAILSSRVRRARIPIDYVWIRQYQWWRASSVTKNELPSIQEIKEKYGNFVNTMKEFHEKSQSEGVPFIDLGKRFSAVTPVETADLPVDSWLDIQECDFSFWGHGRWFKIIDDPEASNGKTVQIPGGVNAWPIYYYVPNLPKLEKLHAYVVARCDVPVDANSKSIGGCGVYDVKNKKSIVDVPFVFSADGKYKTYDLGVRDFSNGNVEIYVRSGDFPIYVDRFFLVKDVQ